MEDHLETTKNQFAIEYGIFNVCQWLTQFVWYLFLWKQWFVIPSDLQYKSHLSRQRNCWSLRHSWSITCRRCSNYIFILDLTPGFNGLGINNCKMRRETLKCWDLVCLILEVWKCILMLDTAWYHITALTKVELKWVLQASLGFYCKYVGENWLCHNGTIMYQKRLHLNPLYHLFIIKNKSTLVQVMAWCQQATSHCLRQFWSS